MIEDKVNASGEVSIILRDAQGNIKEAKTIPNSVVTVGKGVIASRLTGVSTSVMSYMAVGTNSTATAASNTTLGAEIASSRTALTTAGGVATNNVINFIATFGAGVGNGAIVEAGIFNSSSTGSMLCRTTFLAVNKDVGDSLTISWNVTIN